MIYEYALDPTLAAQWSAPREFQRYHGKFGLGTARVMCRVPHRHWRRLVWEAFEVAARDLSTAHRDAQRRTLEEVIKRSLDAGTSRRSCGEAGSWVNMALGEHGRRAFQALLLAGQTATDGVSAPTLRDGDFDEDSKYWSPDHELIPRTPEALTRALRPLLSFARELRLVEPHVDATKPKWRRPLSLLLKQAADGRLPDELPSVELHTCVSRSRGMRPLEGQTHEEQTTKAKEPAAGFDALTRELPEGLAVDVYFWAERVGGPDFHDRFLLSDVGGLHLGKGFDSTDEQSGKDETITLLPRGIYVTHWARYSRAGASYDLRWQKTVKRGEAAGVRRF